MGGISREFSSIPVTRRRHSDNEQKNRDAQFAPKNGAEGTPLTHLVGDAQVMSKWGQQSIDANPDMMKAYRRARNLEPLWRFCFPTAVEFDPKTDRIIVADSQRNRLQIYRKVRDYVDFQANL